MKNGWTTLKRIIYNTYEICRSETDARWDEQEIVQETVQEVSGRYHWPTAETVQNKEAQKRMDITADK